MITMIRKMRLHIPILLLLFLVARATATCSLIQTGTNGACGTASTCAVTGGVGSTGSGHLIEMFAASGGGTDFLITAVATGAGTAILCPASGCHANGSLKTVDQSYILSSSVSATVTITLNGTVAGNWNAAFKEYSCTGALTFDLGTSLANASCTTSCLGASITPTATDLIFETCNGSPNCTAVTSPFNGDVTIFSGDGVSAAGGQTTTQQPTWTLSTTGPMVFSAMAFKEAQPTTIPHPSAIVISELSAFQTFEFDPLTARSPR